MDPGSRLKYQELQNYWTQQSKKFNHAHGVYEVMDNRLVYHKSDAKTCEDVFSTKHSTMQGVYAIRDVLVREALSPPFYDFPSNDEMAASSSSGEERTLKRLSRRRTQSKNSDVASRRYPGSTKQETLNGKSDWCVLDSLFTKLCGVSDHYGEENRCPRNGYKKISRERSTFDRVVSRAVMSPIVKKVSKDFSSTSDRRTPPIRSLRSGGSHTFTPPRIQINQKPIIPSPVSPTTVVVYPIAKYTAKLNCSELVEQRRLSLRHHLTFKPVQRVDSITE